MRNKYVVSYDVAMRLKQAGVHSSTMFYYLPFNDQKPQLISSFELNEHEVNAIPAHTAPELGRVLPPYVFKPEYGGPKTEGAPPYKLLFYRDELDWVVEYRDLKGNQLVETRDRAEADARGKMVIYLVSHGYFDPEDLVFYE